MYISIVIHVQMIMVLQKLEVKLGNAMATILNDDKQGIYIIQKQ